MSSEFWAGILIAAVAPAAIAPPQGVIELSKRRYECSSGAGTFEQTEISHLVRGNILTGRIKFLAAHQGSRLHSAGGLAFRLEDGSAGVFLTVQPGDRHHAYLMLKLPGDGKEVLLGRVDGDEAIVRLMLDKHGVLSVRSDWMSYRVQLESPIVVGRVLHCQSGRYQFLVGSY